LVELIAVVKDEVEVSDKEVEVRVGPSLTLFWRKKLIRTRN